MAQNNSNTPNPNAFMTSDTKTELTDSLLHTDFKRVIIGIVCGVVAGVLMLLVSMAFTPVGYGKLWWFQVLATACCPETATRFDAPQSVFLSGAIIHFAVCVLLGLAVGKMTSGKSSVGRMFFFGIVLTFLCWLASNMFAPDIFNVSALGMISEWHRVFIFGSFALPLLLMMSFVKGEASHA